MGGRLKPTAPLAQPGRRPRCPCCRCAIKGAGMALIGPATALGQHVPHTLTGQVPLPNYQWLAYSLCWHVTWVKYGYAQYFRFTVPHPLSLNIFVFCGLWSPRLCAGCKRRWSATLLGNALRLAWLAHVRGRAWRFRLAAFVQGSGEERRLVAMPRRLSPLRGTTPNDGPSASTVTVC